jgi:formamidase
LAAGRYTLPWEAEVKVVDGSSCGFPVASRIYSPAPAFPMEAKAAK